jgi:Amt family ammonium transporter
MIYIGGEELLEHLEIDDAIGAIPTHLGAGIWGTLAVGLYGDLDTLGTGLTRTEQIGVQLLGIASCAVWAFGIAFVVLTVLNRVASLRVPAAHEDVGLNLSEHGEIEDYEVPDHVVTRIREAVAQERRQAADDRADPAASRSEAGA